MDLVLSNKYAFIIIHHFIYIYIPTHPSQYAFTTYLYTISALMSKYKYLLTFQSE